jgi:hypothetical protein
MRVYKEVLTPFRFAHIKICVVALLLSTKFIAVQGRLKFEHLVASRTAIVYLFNIFMNGIRCIVITNHKF